MIGKMYPAQKIHARGQRLYEDLVWVKREPESVGEKTGHFGQERIERRFVARHDHEVIGVAYIIFYF